MASERLDLTPEIVKKAMKIALEGTKDIVDFCDALQPYLVLRVRGHAASWLVKTRARTLKIGDVMPAATAAKIPELRRRGSAIGRRVLGLREARETAKREWAKIANPSNSSEENLGWTWGKLAARAPPGPVSLPQTGSGYARRFAIPGWVAPVV